MAGVVSLSDILAYTVIRPTVAALGKLLLYVFQSRNRHTLYIANLCKKHIRQSSAVYAIYGSVMSLRRQLCS